MSIKSFLASGCVLVSMSVYAADVEIIEPYARASMPGKPNSAAFLKIINNADKDVSIIAASSEASEHAELHTHKNEDGMLKMVQAQKLLIPAKSSIELKPGGDHIMLIGLKAPLKAGESTSVTLKFDDGDSKKIQNIMIKEISL